MRFLIFGAGYSARAFAQKSHVEIAGTTRTKDHFSSLEKVGITPLLFPSNDEDSDLIGQLQQTTHLVISIAPDEHGDIVLRDKILSSKMPRLEWICYLSTIGVYGNHNGEWIDETADCNPSLVRNKMRLIAEKNWEAFAAHLNVPIATLRLGGIYGPGRNIFLKLQQNKAQRIIKKGQVFNRVHVDDIAGVIDKFSQTRQDGLFNVVDNTPCPPQDIITYAAKLMGINPPPEIPFEQAEMSKIARTFYSDNKKILNHKLLKTGYKLKQPDYRTALNTMWSSGSWQ